MMVDGSRAQSRYGRIVRVLLVTVALCGAALAIFGVRRSTTLAKVAEVQLSTCDFDVFDSISGKFALRRDSM
jgi:hypothetical protein